MSSRGPLRDAAASLDLSLSDEAYNAINVHLALLRKWAPRVNLVSVGDLPHAEYRHAADALSLLRLESFQTTTGRLIDVGSGAGFPGIPLAAVRRDLDITLLEPRLKRGAFITQVLAQAGLSNARWYSGRLPDPSLHGMFDVVVSRATFPPPLLIERVTPLLKPGGIIFVMSAAEIQLPHNAQLVERDAFVLQGLERRLTAVRVQNMETESS